MKYTTENLNSLSLEELITLSGRLALTDEEFPAEVFDRVETIIQAKEAAKLEATAAEQESPEGVLVDVAELFESPFFGLSDKYLKNKFEAIAERIREAAKRWRVENEMFLNGENWLYNYSTYFNVLELGGVPTFERKPNVHFIDMNKNGAEERLQAMLEEIAEHTEARFALADEHLAIAKATPEGAEIPIVSLVNAFRVSVCGVMTTFPRSIDPRDNDAAKSERESPVVIAAGRLVHYLEEHETHPLINPLVIPVKHFVVRGFLAMLCSEQVAIGQYFRDEEKRTQLEADARLSKGWDRKLKEGADPEGEEVIHKAAVKVRKELSEL